ncbi:DUF1801 domain-containing protein [Myxococcota bacterium]|nr:DUF1801 domain-containing protein [Myxococcota bacterium]
MSKCLRFHGATRDRTAIDGWFATRDPALAALARAWFAEMRACGPDVTELVHDGYPTACVEDAAFGYVGVFTAHVNIGFFQGASLPDPAGLLQGDGRFMRRVRARPDARPDADALRTLIRAAYDDIKARLASEAAGEAPRV